MAYGSLSTSHTQVALDRQLCLSQKKGDLIMLERIRKALLKLPSIKKAVSDYNRRKKEARRRERWARLMSANYTVRNLRSVKLEPFDTLPVVGEGGMYEERLNGKVVGNGYIDSENWGRMQS
jgi:hypothetical protein